MATTYNQPPSIAVGARLFSEKGYAATTTRQLSSAMGITNGTFYHYYESKEDLLLRICEESLGRITAAATKAIEESVDGRELESLIQAHINTMLSDQHLHRTMLTELRSLSGTRLTKVIALRDLYSSLVEDVIRRAQAVSIIRSDISSHVLSLLLLNLLNWTIFWFDPAGELSSKELADVTIDLFLDGASNQQIAE